MDTIKRKRSGSEWKKEFLSKNKKWASLALASIPMIVASYYQFPGVKASFDHGLVSAGVSSAPEILNTYQTHILMIAIAIPIIMAIQIPSIFVYFKVDFYKPLLSAIEDVVLHKAENIGALLKEARDDKAPLFCDRILRKINPEEQLKKNISSLKEFLSNYAKEQDDIQKSGASRTNFKIVIFPFEKGEILDKPIHLDGAHPMLDCRKLMKHDTAVKRAFLGVKSVCIQDTSSNVPDKSGGLFIEPGPGEDNASLLCIPIFEEHLREVVMVLSILCENRPNYFLRSELIGWTELLYAFISRIKLEYCNNECIKHVFRSCDAKKSCPKKEA